MQCVYNHYFFMQMMCVCAYVCSSAGQAKKANFGLLKVLKGDPLLDLPKFDQLGTQKFLP